MRHTEQRWRRHVLTLLQPLRLFFWGAALTAAICLITEPGAAQATGAAQAGMPWVQELTKDPALRAEFGQLMEKLRHGVQFPLPRGESRLLPVLPESTIFYAAFPNYGDAFHQVLAIFQQELQHSPVLRAWWQNGAMAAMGPKVEDSLENVYQLSQFLGDEIVVSVATEGRQGPSFLILAEVKKPGLKVFLQQMAKHLATNSNPPFRVYDVQELATAKDTFPPQQPVVLVRPDLVVATLDFGQLRISNAGLNRNNREFVSSAFGQRVAQTYEGGATVVGGIDLQRLLKQIPPGTAQNQAMFKRTGFADMKYLVWDHKAVSGQSASQMELSFTGPRHGIAGWLAAPGPMGSLDFVSPKPVVIGSVLLKNPAQIFDEIKDLSSVSNPQAFATITQMEAAFKLSLREDLLRRLGGEITLEVDSVEPTNPVWKVILQVNDPEHLQATLDTLLAAMHLTARTSPVEDGVTYHSLRIPSGKKVIEIAYAFVDGYMVIGSGRETVAEAVQLHRSGESFAKSKTLLASLPPGHGSEVSGLLYENPAALAALNMRRIFPEMAESLSHTTEETAPVMIYAYGEESALREVSKSGGFDAGLVLAGAAIAVPNLLRARIAANESSAVATIRTANTAQVSYSSIYPQRGFARDLATLGPDPGGAGTSSAEHASLIDATLGNASCTAGAWCTKSGFQFSITAVCQKQRCEEFVVVGTPVSSSTGTRSFCSTSDAVVRYKPGDPLSSPVSVSECQRWSPLR
jgi:type IV pilus assembly protein PilA